MYTWTLKTPHIGAWVAALAWLKISSMALKSPVMSLIFGDFWRSRCADADLALRVKARISKGAFTLRRALIVEPPCFPVAPVMRIARDAIVEVFGM
jgi:hypothetical protein